MSRNRVFAAIEDNRTIRSCSLIGSESCKVSFIQFTLKCISTLNPETKKKIITTLNQNKVKYLSYVSMAKANNLSHDWLKFPTTSLHHSPGKQFFSFFRPWDKDRFMAPDIEAVLKLVKKGKVCAEVYSRAD